MYLPSPRIAHPHYYDTNNPNRITSTEPPPAHRTHAGVVPPPTAYTAQSPLPTSTTLNLSHIQREREQREKEIERSSLPGKLSSSLQLCNLTYNLLLESSAPYMTMPTHGSLVPASNRQQQLTTPPHASQVPAHADTLPQLLHRYPVMWQGLLALKTEQAAVQMHFVFGNNSIAKSSLPFNIDRTTPPLRIAQRMRLEQSQIEGVARKMQVCTTKLINLLT